MPGARCTRGLVCQKLRIWRTRAYRAAETLRHPLRNGFTAYFVLSPVERACCHRHRRDTSRQLDASIAASGPHDFAVRFGVFVRREKRLTPKRPSHPLAQRIVTIAKRPSCGPRMTRLMPVICPTWKAEYFFARGLTRFLEIRSDLSDVPNLSHLALPSW